MLPTIKGMGIINSLKFVSGLMSNSGDMIQPESAGSETTGVAKVVEAFVIANRLKIA